MEIGIGLIGGLIAGAIIGFVVVQLFLKKGNQGKIDEMNAKADLVVKEARLTAKRMVDEAETKAEKIMSKAESKHESIKQKKIQEKADAALVEQKKQEEEAKKVAEETAKRIRDGLQPKYVVTGSDNVCDYCQKIVKGRKRKDMFTRLDYKYCSSDCVQKHKRELMASAALARFGN